MYDEHQSVLVTGMKYLVEQVGHSNFRKENARKLRRPPTLLELPSFRSLRDKYAVDGLYERLADPVLEDLPPETLKDLPVDIGLDIGSTMAKMVIVDSRTGRLLLRNAYENHGDTIETIKKIFQDLIARRVDALRIQNIGITGSGRYQVQKALRAIYPHLDSRITVMVENYAHAWGSMQFAKDHIAKLKSRGVTKVNEAFCLLIDIGGEDTKISVISLDKAELFDNAMNIKCSAGTGSLMDTLKALFEIEDIAVAYDMAFEAERAYGINATCAVFLMENARKMQAEGFQKDEILASCCYAIVENMARSLWDQLEFPADTIVLLHGQTMMSDPLPLAVTHRVQEYMGSNGYCLVPPFPGHRACLGLVQRIADKGSPEIEEHCDLKDLMECKFEKQMIICHGAACGDKSARCTRTRLKSADVDNRITLTLGGCTAVNELLAREKRGDQVRITDAYKDIWQFIDGKLPKTEAENRLVIPRSFAVSEKAFFFAKIFEHFGIPVHCDNVRESDILEGQPLFSIDTCAPNIGATGQFLRLARDPHGIVLVPQIDFLAVSGESIGRTCTTNQGGVLIAYHSAQMRYPEACFKIIDINFSDPAPRTLVDQLYHQFQSIFAHYNVRVTQQEL